MMTKKRTVTLHIEIMLTKTTATYKVAAFLLVVPERFERPTLRFVVWHFMAGQDWAKLVITGYIGFLNFQSWPRQGKSGLFWSEQWRQEVRRHIL